MNITRAHGSLLSFGRNSCNVELPLSSEFLRTVGNNSQISRLDKAIVKIVSETDCYQQYGTGVLINENGLLLTALHVIMLDGSKRWRDFYALLPMENKEGHIKLKFSVVNYSIENDLALLALPPGRKYKYMKMSDVVPTIGDTVFTIGFPENTKRISKGTTLVPVTNNESKKKIAQFFLKGSELTCNELMFLEDVLGNSAENGNIVSTNDVNCGNSGGPLIDRKGMLAGILTAFKGHPETVKLPFQEALGINLDEFPVKERIAISRSISQIKTVLV